MARDIKTLYIDVDRGLLCEPFAREYSEHEPDSLDSSSSSSAEGLYPTVETSARTSLYTYSGYILHVYLHHSDGSPFNLTWALTLDGSYGNPSDPLVTILNADFSVIGDWQSETMDVNMLDKSSGRISLRIIPSAAVSTDIGRSSQKTHYLEIRGTDEDSAERVICVVPMVSRQTVSIPG